jgi:hypothetical protein
MSVLTVYGLPLLVALAVFWTNPEGSLQEVFSAVILTIAFCQPLKPELVGVVGIVAVIASGTPPLFCK